MKLGFQKKALIITVGITALLPVLFVKLNEPTLSLNLYKALAKIGSLCGSVLLVWQMLLGFRGIGGRIVKDFIWGLKFHKTIGKYALFLILLHPVFITIYYLDKYQINLFTFSQEFSFNILLVLGILSFAVMIAIVVSSIFWRTKISFKSWFSIHVLSYPVLAMIFIHALGIGQTIAQTHLKIIWVSLFAFIIVEYVYRLIRQAGLKSERYTVKSAKNVGDNATEILCQPEKNKINPKIGQFVYFRQRPSHFGRPFTVSKYENANLALTVKAQGRYTSFLQKTKPGQHVLIDGPYGVFAQNALDSGKPLVMIAGGIGISPFYRILTGIKNKRQMFLFYGNKNEDDIIYRKELDQIQHVKVIHVLNEQENFEGEKGFITLQLIKKYLKRDLNNYEFLLCGPPVMITKIEQELLSQGISSDHIHHEIFSF